VLNSLASKSDQDSKKDYTSANLIGCNIAQIYGHVIFRKFT